MKINETILSAATAAAEGMNPETECVHVRKDGTCTTGTDGKTTIPETWRDVAFTFHPDRADDAWDCFEQVDSHRHHTFRCDNQFHTLNASAAELGDDFLDRD